MRMSLGLGWSGFALLVGCSAAHPLEQESVRTEALSWGVQQIDDPEAANEDLFGYGVSASGDTALVGALRIGSEVPGATHGAVYAYARAPGGWQQQGPALSADDGQDFDNFGQATAVDGDMALIAAHNRSLFSPLVNSGSAYVFTRSGGIWTQQGPAFAPTEAQGFGAAISISGNSALIGADFSGAVYSYTRSGSTWTQQGSAFSAKDASDHDSFGFALQLAGDTAVIGAYNHPPAGTSSGPGSAYIFTHTAATWAQQAEFTSAPSDGGFGVAVALSADASTALVGAEGSYYTHGVVYVYTRSGAAWTQQGAPLTAPSPATSDFFGSAVAIQGDTIWIAAEGGGGAIYRFTRSAGVWTQQDPVLLPTGSTSGNFGRYMAVSGNTVWVSDPYGTTPTGSAQQGEEYVFSLDTGACNGASDCDAGGGASNSGAAGEAGATGASNVGGAGDAAGASNAAGTSSGGAGVGGTSGGSAGGTAGARNTGASSGDAGQGGAGFVGGASSGGDAGSVSTTSHAGENDGVGPGGDAGASGGGSSPSNNGSAANGDSSCGCRVAGRRGYGEAPWLALGLLGWCTRKRRSRA